ncbi:MAG TPA: hypothetical protein EYH30_03130 [Anaerolineales bacterium]|nr:hypothetical protein [Anaerolineae bacterium]HIQ01113.1 hypothetical protein [Anaerolineales bacterium]
MSGFSFDPDRLSGRRLTVAVVVWVLVLLLGVFFLWWGFFAKPGEMSSPPTATPTEAGNLVPLAAETPIPPAGATPQATLSVGEEVFGYGIQTHGVVGDPEYTMQQVENLGLGWVKQQVRWAHFEPNPGQMDWSGYDAVIEAANRHGLRVMLSVVDAPDWTHTSYTDSNPEGAPPDDLSLFADFLGRLVDRYRGRIHAIEVWNEENLDREWDTTEGVNAERYVEMLRMAYQTIKSRDPNIIVISGALSPVGATATDPNNPSRIIYMDDFQYYQEMIAHNFLDYCDCVGVHHNGYNIPPDVAYDEPYQDDTAIFRGFWDNPHPSWSFRSTLWRYYDAIGGAKPLCVTEFGWASSEGWETYPPGFEFAQDNTEEEQAAYIMQAYRLMREWGFVRLAFLWNLDFAQKDGIGPTDPNAPYSILDFTGAARPAFEAVGAMEKPQGQ